eukprot:SAG31_NODE_5387_length_2571_cov_6.280744_1_plen_106_part_00
MAADDFQIEQEAHVRNAAAAMASPKHANGAVNVQQESVQGDDILAEIESTLEWKRGEMINTEDAFEIMANHKIRVAMAVCIINEFIKWQRSTLNHTSRGAACVCM